jgi:hypothetical protein
MKRIDENMTAQQTELVADLRAKAADALRNREESFQRCDTDGFLSQWASGILATLRETQAAIVAAGDRAEFVGLYDGDRRVAATLIYGLYGPAWMLRREDEEPRYGRRFVPFVGVDGTSRVQKNLGLRERREMAPAAARITGEGHGLSGRAWVETFRTGDRWGQDANLTEDEV